MSIGMQSGRRALTRYVVMKLWAFRRLQRESEYSPFVFVSERGSPFTTAGFARMVERSGCGQRPDIVVTNEWPSGSGLDHHRHRVGFYG
jgi:hypothetical protein